MGKQCQTLFSWAPKSLQMVIAAMKLKDAYSLVENLWPRVAQSWTRLKRLSSSSSNRQHIKKQRHYFVNKGPSSQGYGFSSSHVLMWLHGYPTGQSWRRSVLNIHWKDWCWSWNWIVWLPNGKSWLIWKDPEVGKDWRQEKKVTTEDEMVGWHHRLNGHEFE